MRVLIINGFDRCGSSLIGGLLGKHPDVAYFFQPLSSTEVHRTQYDIWRADHEAPGTENFFRGIVNGRIDQEFITSDWFERHSTSLRIRPEKLNLIKETKLHFKIDWLRTRFPQIEILGIWRDPRAVVCSLVRNEFHRKWYGQPAFDAIGPVIRTEPALAPLRGFLDEPLDEAEQMAVIVAARTRVMADCLETDDWIVFEDILADPNAALRPVLDRWGLEPFDFVPHMYEDYNVVGRPFESASIWRTYFSGGQIERLSAIFGACRLLDADMASGSTSLEGTRCLARKSSEPRL